MYLQLTTRCNMTCAHCCFACTKDGEDMSLETFRDAIKIDGSITLGGGEPTLHKHFDTMLLESLAAVHGFHGDGHVSVITNGSITNRALVLAQLGKAKVVDSQLSRDDYHDEIDPRVVDAFESFEKGVFGRQLGIRNTTDGRDPHPHGRAVELLGLDDDELTERTANGATCMCHDFIVKPNGEIVQCGCNDSPVVGNAKDGVDVPSGAYGECCHSATFESACAEDTGKYEHLLV